MRVVQPRRTEANTASSFTGTLQLLRPSSADLTDAAFVLLLGLEIDTEVERAKQLTAGMPAEDAVKLPPKDVSALEKKVEKQEQLEEKGYELRATHEDR